MVDVNRRKGIEYEVTLGEQGRGKWKRKEEKQGGQKVDPQGEEREWKGKPKELKRNVTTCRGPHLAT